MSPIENPRVIAIGESLVDMIPQEDGSLKPVVGGSPLNVAVALSRQGIPAAMISPVSSDGFGRMIFDHLEGSGVDVSHLPLVDAPTTLAIPVFDAQRKATYSFYINGCSQGAWEQQFVRNGPRDGDILTVSGSFALSEDPMGTVFDEIFEVGSKYHTIVFDPNVRPSVIGESQEKKDLALQRFERWAAKSTIVKASDEDLAFLYPEKSPGEVAAQLIVGGTKMVAITLGGEGAMVFTASARAFAGPAHDGAEIAGDTVGAGDTFNAGMVKWLIDHQSTDEDALSRLTDTDLASLLDAAQDLAFQVCQEVGANPPWAQGLRPQELSTR